jgi:Cd2+/Zn2+-exporting ATPase
MTAKLRLDLPLLLPEVPDERDACVGRLERMLGEKQGILDTHIVQAEKGEKSLLCLHYDADSLSLREVERIATRAGAEITNRFGHVVLPIRAIDGEDAARRIEDELRAQPGVLSASLNLAAQRVGVEFDRERTSMEALRSTLKSMGYASAPPAASEHGPGCCQPKEPVPESAGWYAHHKELVWSLVAGLLLLAAWVGARWLGMSMSVAVALYLASYAFGGFDLVRHWFGSLRKGRLTLDIDLLMLLAAVGAAALGQWVEGAFLLFLFSLAHALEHYALGRARGAIRALADLAPPTARVLRDDKMAEVPVDEVRRGDVVVVRPAERIPVDGEVQNGHSVVNQAPITGESVPVEKSPGDEVYAGTVNGDGALFLTTTRAAGDRTLDRVIALVEEAQTQKAPTQRFTERFERVFVPTVLVADALLIVLPPLFGFWPWSVSFYRAMAMLVAASPCALALGTPSAVLAGIAQAARNGVLIKGGAHLENLGRLRAIAFDKTGTLTVGEPRVTDVVPATGVSADELLALAAAVERHSQHPLAQAVVAHTEARKLPPLEAEDLESLTARGVRARVRGEVVEVGNLRLWEESGAVVPEEVRQAVTTLQQAGRSTMAARHGDRWLGVIGVADQPREGVRQVLDRLRGMGIQTLAMLTGDNRGVGEAIAREVGVSEVRAELLPEDKVTAVRELLREHGQVAMVGDGVNDAPALAHATVGIAMGGAGTAVALETADVALMGDELAKLPFAVGLSRQARGIIRQNLYVSLGVIALLILATTTGVIGIGPAVFIHEGSTLVVIGNALRLLGYGAES